VRGLKVVEFRSSDVRFGMNLTDAEEWHRTVADWRRLLALEPKGVFKAVVDGRDAGVAAVITYDNIAWIHSVIVLRDLHRMGIGTALVNSCLEFVKNRNVTTVKLDSVSGCESFYERLGFIREFESMRFFGKGSAFKSLAQKADESDLDEICAFDRATTGLDRQRVLHAIHRDAPELSYLLRKQGKLRGYLLGRRGDDRIQIGPCVVSPNRSSYAKELFSGMMKNNQGISFRACVPGTNIRAKTLIEKLGLKRVDSATRMYRGLVFKEAESVYATVSAEKG